LLLGEEDARGKHQATGSQVSHLYSKDAQLLTDCRRSAGASSNVVKSGDGDPALVDEIAGKVPAVCQLADNPCRWVGLITSAGYVASIRFCTRT
jgi:hypothetical protein